VEIRRALKYLSNKTKCSQVQQRATGIWPKDKAIQTTIRDSMWVSIDFVWLLLWIVVLVDTEGMLGVIMRARKFALLEPQDAASDVDSNVMRMQQNIDIIPPVDTPHGDR